MKDLKTLVFKAKQNDPKAMEEIIDLFAPLLGKYTRKMQQDEDAASALTLSLMEVVHTVRPDSFAIPSDYALINYFQKSIHHEYIRISKKQALRRKQEYHWEDDTQEEPQEYTIPDETSAYPMDQALLYMTLRQHLTKREYHCIDRMILRGDTALEVAKDLGISKQAVNQCKLRGIKKLREIYTA